VEGALALKVALPTKSLGPRVPASPSSSHRADRVKSCRSRHHGEPHKPHQLWEYPTTHRYFWPPKPLTLNKKLSHLPCPPGALSALRRKILPSQGKSDRERSGSVDWKTNRCNGAEVPGWRESLDRASKPRCHVYRADPPNGVSPNRGDSIRTSGSTHEKSSGTCLESLARSSGAQRLLEQ